jgi:hypothetical protein
VKIVRYTLTFPTPEAEVKVNDAKFVCENNAGFYISTTGEWKYDSNSQNFAVPGATVYDSYKSRFKGGKTSASKTMTITVPNDGTLYIAARSSSGSATDRTMALKQNGTEILAPTVIKDADKFTAGDASAFPYTVVNVKAGDIQVELNNGINFYGIVYDAIEGAPAKVDKVWDFSAPEWVDIMTATGYAAGTDNNELNVEYDGLKVVAGGKSFRWNKSGDVYFWQPNGAGSTSNRYFEFQTDVPGVLTVYASNTGGTDELTRFVTVKVGDADPESLAGGYSANDGPHALDFNVAAGTVKVYPTGKGLRFYKIEFHSK